MKASKKEFVAETEEILFECRQLVLEIQDTYQKAVNPDTINAFFRAIHTLKGLSGLFGNQAVTAVSHGLESLLDEVRLGKVNISGEVVDFFSKHRYLVSALEAVKKTGTRPHRIYTGNKDLQASLREGESGLASRARR
jgi:two-component system chemotaxis sensor kinase CheA